MPKIKFRKDLGPKWPKDGVAEKTDEIVRSLTAAGYVVGADYDDVVEDPADEVRRTVQEAITSEVQTAIRTEAAKLFEGVAKPQVPRISFGDEEVDKDPRRCFRNMGDFAMAVYLSGAGPSQLERADGTTMRDVHEAQQKLTRAHLAQTKQRAVGSDEINTTSGPYGAWLLPTAFAAKLMTDTVNDSVILNDVQPVPMTTQKLDMTAFNDNTHASGQYFGGVQAYWVAEMAQKSMSRPAFRKVELALHDLAVMIPATKQMLKYSPVSLEPLLTTVSAKVLRATLEEDVFNGNGVGKPEGIVGATATIAVNRQTATSVTWQDVRYLWRRVPTWLRSSAKWYYNPDVEEQLWILNQASGTAGQLLYVPPRGAADAPYLTLMGRPCVATEHCQALGTKGDIAVIAPSMYLWGYTASGIDAAVSMHLRFDYNETVFRYELEADGRCWANEAQTTLHGTYTHSPYVVLDVPA